MSAIAPKDFDVAVMLILGSIWVGNAFSAEELSYKIVSSIIAIICFSFAGYFLMGDNRAKEKTLFRK